MALRGDLEQGFWCCFICHAIVSTSLFCRIDPTLGPVVRRLISANPGWNFNAGFFLFCLKAFSRIIFSLLFRASNHQLVDKKNKLNLLLRLSYLNSNFALTLCYLNPALNNPALLVAYGK